MSTRTTSEICTQSVTSAEKTNIKRKFGVAFLLAGTAIGSGMLSLPMVLAKFGVIKSCIIMVLFAFLTYLTAIIRADLNINLNSGATLSECGNAFDCHKAGVSGNFLLKLLSFALISAYLFGLASLLKSLCNNMFSQTSMIIAVAIGIAGIFFFASDAIVNANKSLFIGMFCALMILILKLLIETPINTVPHQTGSISLNEWTVLVPIIFTSFGFQGSMHSVTKFCRNDRSIINSACFWGCVITALIYIIWTIAILLVVANTDANFFNLMVEGKATDVGELVNVLSRAASSQSVQAIVWIVSALAILTSVLGAGLALLEIFKREHQETPKWKIVSFVVFVPAAVSMFVPNAFIRILGISGIILACIAIVIPIIISIKMQKIRGKECKLLLRNKAIMGMVMACGILIIGLGLWDLLR